MRSKSLQKTQGTDMPKLKVLRLTRNRLFSFVIPAVVCLFLANIVLGQSPRTAADYYRRAYQRQATGDLEGAIAEYDKAVQFDPKYSDAYLSRGIARYLKGDMEE